MLTCDFLRLCYDVIGKWLLWYMVYWFLLFLEFKPFDCFWLEFFIILCIWILLRTEGGDYEFCRFCIAFCWWMLYFEPLDAWLPGFELIEPTLYPEALVFYVVCWGGPRLSTPTTLVAFPLLLVPSIFLLLMLIALPPWLPWLWPDPLPFSFLRDP